MASSKKKNHRKKVQTPFAHNLETLLRDRDITLRAAAQLAGVSQSVISGWIAGAQPNDLLAVQRLARALNADFEKLLTGSSSGIDPKKLAIGEIFDSSDFAEGIFEVSLRRLTRKK